MPEAMGLYFVAPSCYGANERRMVHRACMEPKERRLASMLFEKVEQSMERTLEAGGKIRIVEPDALVPLFDVDGENVGHLF